MDHDKALGSVHLAISHLASTLAGVETDNVTLAFPHTIEFGGRDRLFLLEDGVIVFEPDYNLLPSWRGPETAVAINTRPYEKLPEKQAAPGQPNEQPEPGPTFVPAGGGTKPCPACKGTGVIHD